MDVKWQSSHELWYTSSCPMQYLVVLVRGNDIYLLSTVLINFLQSLLLTVFSEHAPLTKCNVVVLRIHHISNHCIVFLALTCIITLHCVFVCGVFWGGVLWEHINEKKIKNKLILVHMCELNVTQLHPLYRDIKDTTVGTLSQRITNQVHGLKGLNSKLLDIRSYLERVAAGKLPINHQIIYQLQDVFNLLPDVNLLVSCLCLRSVYFIFNLAAF